MATTGVMSPKNYPAKAITPKQEVPVTQNPHKPTITKATRSVEITTVNVEAYNYNHACRVARAIYGEDIGILVETKTPRKIGKITKCTVSDVPQKGTREWDTEYQIHTYAKQIPAGLNKFDYIGKEFVKGGFKEKAVAVKTLKALVMKHGLPMMLEVHKVPRAENAVAYLAEPGVGKGNYSVQFIKPV